MHGMRPTDQTAGHEDGRLSGEAVTGDENTVHRVLRALPTSPGSTTPRECATAGPLPTVRHHNPVRFMSGLPLRAEPRRSIRMDVKESV